MGENGLKSVNSLPQRMIKTFSSVLILLTHKFEFINGQNLIISFV
jgi:hypothetical protein